MFLVPTPCHPQSQRPRATADAEALTALLAYGAMIVETGNAALGREVIEALRGMGRGAVPALREALLCTAGGRVARMAAAWLLGRVGGDRARRALCHALNDADGDVVAAARSALDGLRVEPSAEVLVAA